MTTTETSARPAQRSGLRTLVFLLIPVVLLSGIITLFVVTDGAGLNVEPVVPDETLQVQQPVLRGGVIELRVRNTSPQDLRIAQVNINDAIWPFAATPSATIPRLGSATITLPYHWNRGDAYQISLLTSNSTVIPIEIPAAAETATASQGTLLSFTLVGVYVGIIPVILGMFWLPALRRLGPRAMMFLMSATVGLLIFLGVDATNEALEQAGPLAGTFQGVGLIAIGIVLTFFLLDAISQRQRSTGRGEHGQRMALALMIATGIGLHNLGEGLAIGAAYAVGAATLGTFLVIGFIIQNITEGLGIIIPIVKDRPALRTLALLGLIGGAPAILGAWIGGFVTSPVLSVLFLSIGAGAIFEVVYEIGRQMIWSVSSKRQMPLTVFSGISAGMLVLYLTGIMVK